ncbi:MAG TPA: hypothetical protein VLA88_04295 [Candidatus Saccharimonadales bacterium]|nr:hypothetical protein [Candidatus Saccharimonadales bacterium]
MLRRNSSKLAPLLIVVLSLAAAAATFVLPNAPTVENALAAHFRTAAAIVLSGFFIGGAILLLRGLRGFKTGLRVAYTLIAIGVLMLSVMFLQLPALGLYDLWQSDWVNSGGVILPFGIGSTLMYIGVRKFAKLLDVRTILRSWPFVIITTAIFTIIMYIAALNLVQYEVTERYEGIDTYIAIIGALGYSALVTGLLARKITNAIGEYYRPAMRWLEVTLLGIGISGLHETFSSFFVNNGFGYVDWGWYLWPFIVTGAIAVVAGYKFRQLIDQADVTSPITATTITDEDYIESITRVSRLASRPQDIDTILDDFRFVTAKLITTKQLSAEDHKRLLNVYRRLEEYLTTKDSLRDLTKEEIRQQATPAFRKLLR